MARSTKPEYMPAATEQAVSWMMQRCSKVAMLGALCFRFGPQSLDVEYAQDCITAGKPVPKTNIQAMVDAVVGLERTIYVFYNHMQNKQPEVSPPGLVERLKEAEIRLTDLAAAGDEMAQDYFKWLRQERAGPATDENKSEQDAN